MYADFWNFQKRGVWGRVGFKHTMFPSAEVYFQPKRLLFVFQNTIWAKNNSEFGLVQGGFSPIDDKV
jgi:hypothetical protein